MYYIRPSWLGHFNENEARQPIYSLDVSSDGARLATGGLDGKVRVWDVPLCIDPPADDSDQTGLLATIPAHTGGVLCVKFSPNRRWLASGSDDKILIIWERDETASTQNRAFGEKETIKEVWKVHRRLVGHENDIVDLAWSHDSALLVSAGLDSIVLIWSGTTFEKKKELNAHASSVKGITFDPAGKYFATESDDRTVKVWRTNDFVCEATIDQPFLNSPISTYFRRPSWSPDGNYIAGANSMNGQVHSVAIIDRGTWQSDINLIGHEGAVEVVKFNPVLFQRDDKHVNFLACAGQDRTLSIWNTSCARPITTSTDITEQGVSDLAWAPSGLSLFVCSFDGSVTVCRFDESEFGKALGTEVNEEALSKYGAGRHGAVMPESVEQLQLEELSRKETEDNRSSRMADLMGSTSVAKEPEDVVMTEARPDVHVSVPTNGSEARAGESQSVADRAEEKVEEPRPTQPVKYVQKVTLVNGKKRIQPQLISNGPAQPTVVVRSQAAPTQTMEISQPSQVLPKGGMPVAIVGNKRPAEDAVQSNNAKRMTEEVPEFLRPAVISPATSVAQIRLGVPQIRSFISHSQQSYILEARNAENAHDPSKLTFMKNGKIEWIDYLRSPVVLLNGTSSFVAAGCEDGGIFIWTLSGRRYLSEIVIEAVPSFLEARDDSLMVISSIGLLHIWNLKEKRSPFPQVSLAPILDAASSVVDQVRRSASITQAGLAAKDIPLVTLSNGDGYMYHADMFSWMKLSEGWWAISSSYWDASGLPTRGDSHGLLGLIERRTNEEVMRMGKGRVLSRIVKQALMKEGFEGFEASVSIAHLENRLSAAALLSSKSEYHTVLIMYARKIAEENMSGKVDELCRELLGPQYKTQTSTWQASIMGLDKRDLLRECLAQMGKFRGVQRVCTEYADLLNKLT